MIESIVQIKHSDRGFINIRGYKISWIKWKSKFAEIIQ